MPDKKAHQYAPAAGARETEKKGPWWKNKRAQIAFKLLGGLFAAGFIMWFFLYMPFTATDDARVDAHTIRAANLGASGQIIKVYVKEGDRVTAGQVLAELDHATAQAQLEKAAAMANFTALDAKRSKAMVSQQGMSQQRLTAPSRRPMPLRLI